MLASWQSHYMILLTHLVYFWPLTLLRNPRCRWSRQVVLKESFRSAWKDGHDPICIRRISGAPLFFDKYWYVANKECQQDHRQSLTDADGEREREREIPTSSSLPDWHKGGSAWISRNYARCSFEYPNPKWWCRSQEGSFNMVWLIRRFKRITHWKAYFSQSKGVFERNNRNNNIQ